MRHTESMPSLYETDYHKWAMETAAALREGRLHDIDFEATAEELTDLGNSQRDSLESAVSQLFMHLLKMKYQPDRSGTSWQISIEKQRRQIAKLTKRNPSLKPLLSDAAFLQEAYADAVLDAALETGEPKKTFPKTCPFTVDDTKIVEAQTPAPATRTRSKHKAKRKN